MEDRRGPAASPGRRTAGRLLVAIAVVLACFANTGCAPQSPDQSSWTDQAHKALEDTASEVATVTLLLRLEADGKVFGKYQQVVAQDSESAVGEVMARFGGEQPPPQQDEAYTRVTSLVSDASDLLSEVRIAVVRRDASRYPDLLDALVDMDRDLTSAAEALRVSSGGDG